MRANCFFKNMLPSFICRSLSMNYIHNESMRAYLLITFYCYLLLYSLILRICLTGTPPTTVFAGTSLVTIKPAAMIALFPMVIYRINEE